MSGRVDFVFSPILPSLPFVREGEAVALGVTSARIALPDVPTTIEAGFANSDYNFGWGCSCRRKPRARSSRLRKTVKVLKSPEIQAKHEFRRRSDARSPPSSTPISRRVTTNETVKPPDSRRSDPSLNRCRRGKSMSPRNKLEKFTVIPLAWSRPLRPCSLAIGTAQP